MEFSKAAHTRRIAPPGLAAASLVISLFLGGAEVQRTEGVYAVAEEDRGAVDVRADSDYQSGYGAASYGGATWRATLRANFASEDSAAMARRSR